MVRKLSSFIRKKRLQKICLREQKIIAELGLFDEGWYVRTYPDVTDFPGGPLAHFLKHGAAEGRSSGPRFDTYRS